MTARAQQDWVRWAAAQIAADLGPADHPVDLMLCVTRRTRTRAEYVLYSIGPGDRHVSEAVYRGDPAGLERAVAGLAGLFDDVTRLQAAQPPAASSRAGGAPSDSSASLAGATGLSGQAFRDEVRRAQAGQAAGRQGDRGRRARQALKRAPGAAYRPGQNRRAGGQA